jgi:hypothetical protein
MLRSESLQQTVVGADLSRLFRPDQVILDCFGPNRSTYPQMNQHLSETVRVVRSPPPLP